MTELLYIYIYTNLISTSIHGTRKKQKIPWPGTRDKSISNHHPGEKKFLMEYLCYIYIYIYILHGNVCDTGFHAFQIRQKECRFLNYNRIICLIFCSGNVSGVFVCMCV